MRNILRVSFVYRFRIFSQMHQTNVSFARKLDHKM